MPGPRDDHDGLVVPRVERRAGRRVDLGHALALEELAQLAVDGGDALRPRVVVELDGSRLDGPVEVVSEIQDLGDQVHAGEAEVALALLRGAALEVRELRALALEQADVLVRLGERFVALDGECLELGGEGGRGGIELVDAFLGAGLSGHGSPGSGGWLVRHRGGR